MVHSLISISGCLLPSQSPTLSNSARHCSQPAPLRNAGDGFPMPLPGSSKHGLPTSSGSVTWGAFRRNADAAQALLLNQNLQFQKICQESIKARTTAFEDPRQWVIFLNTAGPWNPGATVGCKPNQKANSLTLPEVVLILIRHGDVSKHTTILWQHKTSSFPVGSCSQRALDRINLVHLYLC